MKSILFTLHAPSWPVAFVILALEVIIAAILLGWLRRRNAYSQDHLYTGVALVGMTAVVLAILLKIGHVEIKSYGAMLMVGFLAGTYTAVRLGRRRAVAGERLIDLGLVVLVGAILGARLAFVLMNPEVKFFDLQEVLRSGLGGLSFHGGLIGGFLGGSVYIFLTRMDFWRVTDCAAPAISIGYAITRIGCFLNGCCFGKATSLPWGMRFPFSPDAFPHTHTVHPTQLYASAMGFLMFGIVLLLSRGKSLGRAGRLFMVLLVLESVERFVMEIFRYPDPNFHGVLTPAQWVSIAIFVIGIIGFFALPKRSAIVEPQPAPAEPVTPGVREVSP